MLKNLFYLILLPVLINCSGDSISTPQTNDDDIYSKPDWLTWLENNHYTIESVESEDFTDIQFFHDVIGNRSILQLGECSHGVKEFNHMKTRLIKFFHEEMGFDVIAFESSIFSNYYINENFNDFSPAEMMQNSIFQVWHTYEVLELFEYIKITKNTADPLYLAGFDIQPLYHREPEEKRGEMLRDMIYPLDQEYSDAVKTLEDSFIVANRKYIDNRPGGVRELREIFESFLPLYEELELYIENNLPSIIPAYLENSVKPLILLQTVSSIIEYIKALLYEDDNDFQSLFNTRDKAMAENIEFLVEKVYPGKKIMIWAHNAHISHKYSGTYSSMGQWLSEKYRDRLYTIGLYMGMGSVANNIREVYNIINCPIGSLEHKLSLMNKEYLFVDILNNQQVRGNSWLYTSIQALNAGLAVTTLVPEERYDGILYIHNVNPPDYYTSLHHRTFIKN